MDDRMEGALVPRRVEPLSHAECLAALAGQYLGRVAFLRGEAPDVVPMNYVLDDDRVVLRTSYGTGLDTAVGGMVAFEVDHVDPERHAGWSIVIRGRLVTIAEPEELRRAQELPLRPWAPGTRPLYLQIEPEVISGRRIT